MDNIIFSEWLNDQLRERKMTESDLANAINRTRQTINNYMTGKVLEPDPKILVAISKALHLHHDAAFEAAGIIQKQSPRRIAELNGSYKLSLLDDDRLKTANILLDALIEPEEKQTPKEIIQKKSREVQKPPETVVYDREK